MKVLKPLALGLILLLGCGVLSASFGFTTLAQRLMAVGGGGSTYSGPGDVVGSAVGYFGMRSYNGAYATGSNNGVTTVTNGVTAETCDFFIDTSGNLGLAHNCTSTSNGATVATFCALGCTVLTVLDQTGGGNTISQPLSAQQPALVSSTSPFTGYSTAFQFTAANFDLWSTPGTGGTISTSTFTWIAWIKCNNATGTNGILSSGVAGTPAVFFINSSAQLQLDAPGLVAMGHTTATINTAWHQVAVTYDNSTGTSVFYIDGAVQTGGVTIGTQSFTLGHFTWGYAFNVGGMDGFMAEAIVYPSVLNATQITNIYNNATSNP